MGDRQLDILATGPDWYTLPRFLPMRLGGDVFLHFIWPASIDPSRYTVVVEVLDTAGPTYRGISILQRSVEIPHVQYDWHARLGLVPDSINLPLFESEMIRG